MAKVTKDKTGHYTFEDEEYTLDETGTNTLCFISRFDDFVLVTDKKRNVLYRVVSMHSQNEGYLSVENYNK